MKIALAGNPNSGKTTMFNALTGSNEKVGNWAGVTIDKKQHTIKKSFYNGNEKLIAVDLPGAYSMSPFTGEESITSDYIKEEKPDVIINIVDATNLSRSLFFTTELLELGIPLVIALNKADINAKKQTKIDSELLSNLLNCPVVDTISTSSKGLQKVVEKAVSVIGNKVVSPYKSTNINPQDKESAQNSDRERFEFVNDIVSKVEIRKTSISDITYQDKIDNILTDRLWGIPIFAVVMFLVFWISQAGPGVWIADLLVALLEKGQAFVGSLFENANPLLSTLLVDGVIGGVIAVIGFLPLVMVMYFLIALLEDCGYMARVSVVLDPIFKKVGLSGRSVIPFVIGTGCAIPGVMACRTIRDERERRATAMLAPFMPCGAKLPVIALFSGIFFKKASWVGASMYFIGIFIIFIGALLINKITGTKNRNSYFIIELPEYKIPSFIRAFKSMCGRGWEYIVKATTIILICNTTVQVMQSFTWSFEVASSADVSILASIARPFAFALIPTIGILSWEMAAATITGFIAKENVVGTLAVCFGITNFINIDDLVLTGGADVVADTMKIGPVAAIAYLMLNLFSPPCFAAIGAMNSELKSKKWLAAGIGLQLGVGFTVAYLVYQIGTLITTGSLGNGFFGGLIAVAVFVGFISFLCIKNNKKG